MDIQTLEVLLRELEVSLCCSAQLISAYTSGLRSKALFPKGNCCQSPCLLHGQLARLAQPARPALLSRCPSMLVCLRRLGN